MKLTEKDKEFLERLKELLDQGQLWIEYQQSPPGYFVLKGRYGDHVAGRFNMTRQGTRWRFDRMFNSIYVQAYETVLFVERYIGPTFRKDALRIAHDRFALRQQALQNLSFREANSYRGPDQD
jgi:hypothetical protein